MVLRSCTNNMEMGLRNVSRCDGKNLQVLLKPVGGLQFRPLPGCFTLMFLKDEDAL